MRFTKLLTGTILSGVFMTSVAGDTYYLSSKTAENYMDKHIRKLRESESSLYWVREAKIGENLEKSGVSSFEAICEIVADVFSRKEKATVLGLNYYENGIRNADKNIKEALKSADIKKPDSEHTLDEKGALSVPCLMGCALSEMVKAYINKQQNFKELWKDVSSKLIESSNSLFGNAKASLDGMNSDLESYWEGLKIAEALDGLKKFEKEVHENADLLKLKSLRSIYGVNKVNRDGKEYNLIDLSWDSLNEKFPGCGELRTGNVESLLEDLEGVVEISSENNNKVDELKKLLVETAKTTVGKDVLSCLKTLKWLSDEQQEGTGHSVEPVTFKKAMLASGKVAKKQGKGNGAFSPLWDPQNKFHLVSVDITEDDKESQETLLHELLRYYYSIVFDNFGLFSRSFESLNLETMPEVSEYLYGYNKEDWIQKRSKELLEKLDNTEVTEGMLLKLHYKLISGCQYDVLNNDTKNSILDFMKNLKSKSSKERKSMFAKMLVVLHVFDRSPYNNFNEMLTITGLAPYEIKGKNFLVINKANEHAIATKSGRNLRWTHESDELTFSLSDSELMFLKNENIGNDVLDNIKSYFSNLNCNGMPDADRKKFFLHEHLTKGTSIAGVSSASDNVFELPYEATSTSYFYSDSLLENSLPEAMDKILNSYNIDAIGQKKLDVLAILTLKKYNKYAQKLFINIVNYYHKNIEQTCDANRKAKAEKILRGVVRWFVTSSYEAKKDVLINAVGLKDMPLKNYAGWYAYNCLSNYESGTNLRKYLHDMYGSANGANGLDQFVFALPILCQWGVIAPSKKIEIEQSESMAELQENLLNNIDEKLRNGLFVDAALLWYRICHDSDKRKDGLRICLRNGYINEKNIVGIMNDDDVDASLLKDMLQLIKKEEKINLLLQTDDKGKTCFSKIFKLQKEADLGYSDIKDVLLAKKDNELLLQEIFKLFDKNAAITLCVHDFRHWYGYGGFISDNVYVKDHDFENIHEILMKHVNQKTCRATTASQVNDGIMEVCKYLEGTKRYDDMFSWASKLNYKDLSKEESAALDERVKKLHFELVEPSEILDCSYLSISFSKEIRRWLAYRIVTEQDWINRYKAEIQKYPWKLSSLVKKFLEQDKECFDGYAKKFGLDKYISDLCWFRRDNGSEDKKNALYAYMNQEGKEKAYLIKDMVDKLLFYDYIEELVDLLYSEDLEKGKRKTLLDAQVPHECYAVKDLFLKESSGSFKFSHFVKFIIDGVKFNLMAFEFKNSHDKGAGFVDNLKNLIWWIEEDGKEAETRRKYVASILHAPDCNLESFVLGKCLNCWDNGKAAPKTICDIYKSLNSKILSKEDLLFEILQTKDLFDLEDTKIGDVRLPGYAFVDLLRNKGNSFSKVLSDNGLKTSDISAIIKPTKYAANAEISEIDSASPDKQAKIKNATTELQNIANNWCQKYWEERFKSVVVCEFKNTIIVDFYNKHCKEGSVESISDSVSPKVLYSVKNGSEISVTNNMLRDVVTGVLDSHRNGELGENDPIWTVILFEDKNGKLSLEQTEKSKRITIREIVDSGISKYKDVAYKILPISKKFNVVMDLYSKYNKFFVNASNFKKIVNSNQILAFCKDEDEFSKIIDSMLRDVVTEVLASHRNGELGENDPIWNVTLFEDKNGKLSLDGDTSNKLSLKEFKEQHEDAEGKLNLSWLSSDKLNCICNVFKIKRKLAEIRKLSDSELDSTMVKYSEETDCSRNIFATCFSEKLMREMKNKFGLVVADLDLKKNYPDLLSVATDQLNECLDCIRREWHSLTITDNFIKTIFSSESIFTEAALYSNKNMATFERIDRNSIKVPLWNCLLKNSSGVYDTTLYRGITEFETFNNIYNAICKTKLQENDHKKLCDVILKGIEERFIPDSEHAMRILRDYNLVGIAQEGQEQLQELASDIQNLILNKIVSKHLRSIRNQDLNNLINLPISYEGKRIKCNCDVLTAILLHVAEDAVGDDKSFGELFDCISFDDFEHNARLKRINVQNDDIFERLNLLEAGLREVGKDTEANDVSNLIDYLENNFEEE